MPRARRNFSFGVTFLLAAPIVLCAQTPNRSGDEQAIRATAESYRAAFNAGDAKALATLWAEHGAYIDQFGYVLAGRNAIEQSFARFFAKHGGTKLEMQIRSINFPSQDVAVETGTMVISRGDEKGPLKAFYTAALEKHDGAWQLARIHEAPPPPPSNYDHLQPLEWLIGNWIDEEVQPDGEHHKAVVHTMCQWSVNRNFIIRHFTATVDDQVTTTGTQTIAWDAVSKRIRSWSFDSKGGIILGIWSRSGDKWVVRTVEHLQTGEKAHATEILTRQSLDKHTWRTTERSVGDKQLADSVVHVRRLK